ncbi:4,5:9,10-diseco-3-hydroxy-5,9, 17-trioxoandrosta-1(10),2-diene-4-oate hydrolase [Mycobacterium simulans]|uniref:4,5:9,10-diseco-3-hydroxy-5,9, 17-trioxoandrosta-1(10),2-diene-4-oate hydrolase n=1 Tax=Mycobacterium simulans TaxID=627089 RepID=A0A7Z7IPF0_9MYCO|nr:alpha/beta hydrolase [Mycobacterium simulans]SOJ56071.1 4,5:9,10-diseco-3-hydroxy-5,9, 17-trioxoandrosta-1(10),2-diene-4-oate hydrolase [Mycobacterium simulans]
MMPPQLARPWGGAGHYADIAGPVHWVDFGGPAGVPPIVMVHGLGGSHLNWARIARPLTERNRVIAIDLPGFGFTPAAGRRTTIPANTKILDRFINETIGGPVILMGNSMGGAITIQESAASPHAVAAVVLVDPALPRPAEVPDAQVAAQFLMYAVPGVGEAFMGISRRSRTDRELVERVINLCFADPRRSDPELMDAAIELVAYRRLRMPKQDAAFLQAARSIVRAGLRPRQSKDTMKSLSQPVLLIHGDKDRLVPIAAARVAATANPQWETEFLHGVGHTPQLEVPDEVIRTVVRWLDRHELGAAAVRNTTAPTEESR